MTNFLRLLFASLTTLALAAPLVACSSTECVADCGAGGGGGTGGGSTTTGTGTTCDGKTGRIVGHVDYSPDFKQSPVAGALVGLRKAPKDEPIYAKADDKGDYEIDIEAGDWLVSGEDETGCYTDMLKPITVEVCGEITVDLVLDICTG